MALHFVEISSISPHVKYGAKEVDEIIQNVRTILTTRKGTCPLDREFGLTSEFLDTPLPGIRALAEQEIFLQVRKYEPRAEIRKIEWIADIQKGEVFPKLTVGIKDGI